MVPGSKFLSYLRGSRPGFLSLPPHDLLRDRTYRRLWTSILISSFGGQVTLLAVPLTAAVLLHATPTQMGFLTAMEIVAVRAVLAAGRRVARPRAQAARLRGRGVGAGAGRRERAAGLVARLAVHALAVPGRLRDRHRAHHRRQRRADRADPDRAAGAARSRPTPRTRSPTPPRKWRARERRAR